MSPNKWIVCQIGAREHYAIPRALHQAGKLHHLVTDFWVPPESILTRLPRTRRLQDRYHPDLAGATVHAFNLRMLAGEMTDRLRGRKGWSPILHRNTAFQQHALRLLSALSATRQESTPTLFSYSYAALELFRFAKRKGWQTVLGQIDPGPVEERIVKEEHQRYNHLPSQWQPAPPTYWAHWKNEVELADRVIVNSNWSRSCLVEEGVSENKIEVIPLVYEETHTPRSSSPGTGDSPGSPSCFTLLFLGQINLRKGMGRLLDAMRLLEDESVKLILAGPTEIDPSCWEERPNVEWAGPVPRSEISRYYRKADAFILPTLSDGFAITQLEALACGLPVIASKYCGEAVVHGRNGWVLEDLKPETIAGAVRKAVKRPLLSVAPPTFNINDLTTALLAAHA